MTSLATLRDIVLSALGRNDNVSVTLANAVINYSVMMATLIFEPPEMFVTNEVTLASGIDYIYFPNLIEGVDFNETDFVGIWEIDENGDLMPVEGITLNTRLLDIIKIYNDTDDIKMDFIPYDSWDIVVPSGNTAVRYYTLFGNTLRVKSVPTANKTLSISHSTYPALLVLDVDEVPFAHHDPYIISTATGILFAMLEEGESSDMWNKIAALTGEPSAIGQRARALIEGQRTMLESSLSESRG